SHTDWPDLDTIELHNTANFAVNVGGWFLSDSPSNRTKFRIPSDDPDRTTIAPGGYLVFDESDFNPSDGLDPQQHPNDFALNGAHGDDVWLTQDDGQDNPGITADFVVFAAAANGESFARRVDDAGRLHFYPHQQNTLPGVNGLPRVGPVIDRLREEMEKVRSGGKSELLDTLIAYKWDSMFGPFTTDPATLATSGSKA
ncbi:hypothetical protein LCGC14_2960730, partial [marine sediment metagenome]